MMPENIFRIESAQLKHAAGFQKAATEIVRQHRSRPLLAVVEAIEGAGRQMLDAAHKAADQKLVAASTIAEGLRTSHLQIGQRLSGDNAWEETRTLLSRHFEEFYNLLQGIFLLGEISPGGETVAASYGERAAAILLAQALRAKGVPAQAFEDRRFYIAGARGEQGALRETVKAALEEGMIPVVPGGMAEWL